MLQEAKCSCSLSTVYQDTAFSTPFYTNQNQSGNFFREHHESFLTLLLMTECYLRPDIRSHLSEK